MAWHPSDSETFVFRKRGTENTRVVLLIPGGAPNPPRVLIEGDHYDYDEDMTDQTRMYVRVDNRKRGLAD